MNTTSAKRELLLKRATTASVCTALFLVIIKAAAWIADGSVSVLASMVDSLTDSAASIINLIAVRFSLKPADEDHQFGHGKAEGLSAMVQAAFIGGSSVFLILNAIDRMVTPQPLEHTGWGIAVMVVSIICTLTLVNFQKKVLKQVQSGAVEADHLHYVTDLLTNGAAILALILATFGWFWVDVAVGLIIAAWVMKSAWSIAADAFNVLMDKALPTETVEQIRAAALSVEGVEGVHDLRTREAGGRKFVDMHLDLDGNITLKEAHDIGLQAADKVKALFDGAADVVVHHDPADDEECSKP
ncbi:cation diffusion facilitator family transporter [Neisseria wadsworthii]|uniref:Cation-efflux pump FieF n=1 Tax=Neisseria wadsworthii 9715 TaxID=1030841 RepID=G4CR74_9NEIS|nr:cation diffusion facilitator family transporter [Neisseria wadsworthii]EGZ45487.1 CDF family cation diffusion facilitator [Neisseria wadsworthii 9715]QMT35288.1 cation diffusion facilitator family transporter [Neisseria wadsworthii]